MNYKYKLFFLVLSISFSLFSETALITGGAGFLGSHLN